MSATPRWFSTSARVHPNILPFLQPMPRRSTMRWVPVIAGLSIAGVGAKVYIDSARERQLRLEAKYQEEAERQRRNNMLLDVYGGREDLEGLQKAIQFYESNNKK